VKRLAASGDPEVFATLRVATELVPGGQAVKARWIHGLATGPRGSLDHTGSLGGSSGRTCVSRDPAGEPLQPPVRAKSGYDPEDLRPRSARGPSGISLESARTSSATPASTLACKARRWPRWAASPKRLEAPRRPRSRCLPCGPVTPVSDLERVVSPVNRRIRCPSIRCAC